MHVFKTCAMRRACVGTHAGMRYAWMHMCTQACTRVRVRVPAIVRASRVRRRRGGGIEDRAVRSYGRTLRQAHGSEGMWVGGRCGIHQSLARQEWVGQGGSTYP